MSAAVTFGIGSACTSLMSTSCYVVKAGVQAVAHGAFQGMMSAATGGSFWTGFAAGALSSIAASAWSGGTDTQWQGLGGKFADSGLGMIAFGTVAGGAGAQLTGGNFWVGAATGLMVSACNHYMHEIKTKQEDPAKQMAREIVEKYHKGNVKEITDWLHKHPVTPVKGGVQFKGITEVTGIAPPDVQINRASDLGGIAFDYLLGEAADWFVKGTGEFFTDGKLSEPTTTDARNVRNVKATNNLIEKMFMPQTIQTLNMFNSFNPYGGTSLYEQLYRFK